MRKQLTIMVGLILLSAVLTLSVRAQGTHLISVTIPFEFEISGKTLSAGDYYLRRNMHGPTVVFRLYTKDSTQSFYVPSTHTVQASERVGDSKLVFNRYGKQYFLSQVWIAGRSTGEEVAKTSKERLLLREASKHRNKPDVIAVIGKSN